MNQLQALYRRFLASVRYHSEKWNLVAKKYPELLVQTKFDHNGILFEVHNLTEVNRVIFFDDEEDFLSELLSALRGGDTFFDVGACIGVFSLHAARRCKQVVAFEPEFGFRQHLERNVEINGFKNVSVLPYAIANRSETLPLFTNGTDGKSPSLEDDDFKNRIEVEARTLSDLVFRDQLPTPTIIKMDIEGAEILAIRGMKELLSKNPPRLIFLELHPILLTHFSSSSAEVLLLLDQAGYKIRQQSQRHEQVHYVLELGKAMTG